MFILKGISFVLVFFVVTLIAYILQMILNVVFNLPILNSINNIGGVAAGLIKALIKVYVVLAIIYFLSAASFVEPLSNLIDSSSVTKVLYNNNLLVKLLSGSLK